MHVLILFIYHGSYHLIRFTSEYTVITCFILKSYLSLIGHQVKHVGAGDLISKELALFVYRKMMSWYVNQPLDPEGQRWGQTCSDPLGYQQMGSIRIKKCCQRKSLSLSGGQNLNLAFQNSVSSQTLGLNFCQLVMADRGAPSEDIYMLTDGTSFHCEWDWVMVNTASITALNPYKWKWPLPCVILSVWQTAWVWPFCMQSSFAVCPK